MNIPKGDTKTDIISRKRIISRFYQAWKEKNPQQKVYNIHLKDYINIRNISIQETAAHAAKTYLSTLAVLQLDSILSTAKKISTVKPKAGNKKQEKFTSIIVMEAKFVGIGKVKLTVGIKRSNKEKIQYCITSIE